jgi:histidyl-tRNA synthetase
MKPQIPSGFWELSPNKQKQFDEIVQKIEEVYSKNDFAHMDTPVMEYKEILLAKSQGETSKQIFEVEKGDKAYVLRYDLTVPFARFVAEHYNDLTFPFKRYQIGKVYRGERPQKGRYREFYQADIDIVGNEKLALANDISIIATIAEALQAIGLQDYTIQLNNRKVIHGLIEYLQIKNTEEVFILIDKYGKMERKEFVTLLQNLVGERQAKELLSVLEISGQEALLKLSQLQIVSEQFAEGLQELEQTVQFLKAFGVSNKNFTINVQMIRGLDYYTGTIFETTINGYEKLGSIASGGRYADLSSTYINKNLPGVGGSIGVSRLFAVLEEMKFFNEETVSSVQYLIVPIGEYVEAAIALLKTLQSKNKEATVYFEGGKINKAIKYATDRKIPSIIFVGEEEVETGTVRIKNLDTREEKSIKVEEL